MEKQPKKNENNNNVKEISHNQETCVTLAVSKK